MSDEGLGVRGKTKKVHYPFYTHLSYIHIIRVHPRTIRENPRAIIGKFGIIPERQMVG